MKVLMVNGSPHKNGCTQTALEEVASTIKEAGIGVDYFWIGNKPIQECIGCFACHKKNECIFKNDKVNEFVKLAADYDGFIFGTPVYYAGPAGGMVSFMNRVFFSASNLDPHPFKFKPAAAVASARRTGTVSTLDVMNKYFLHGQMPIVPSRYWNEVYGNTPEEVKKDLEGMQVMRTLGRNMAWMLRLKEAGEKAGIKVPEQEPERIATNFIR